MRKMTFLLGIGVGFVLGSRAGRGPYNRLETKARDLAGRPEAQEAAQQLRSAAEGTVHSAAARLTEKLPSAPEDSAPDDIAANG